jgi:hypothetical protein
MRTISWRLELPNDKVGFVLGKSKLQKQMKLRDSNLHKMSGIMTTPT